MMQALGRRYIREFTFVYQRSGRLWEGRYKSCLIQEERYLLEVYRYIELNPVRAGMVEAPEDYTWSSYPVNALGVESGLSKPHSEYLGLGSDSQERCFNYRSLFEYGFNTKIIEQIRTATNKGMVVGSDRFREEIEALTGRRVREKKRGRPVGWRKVKK